MSNLFRNLSVAVLLITTVSLQKAQSQSILDPNDPVINYNPSSPPTQPPAGQIGKWVRTPRYLGWNTDVYKAYIYNGYAFRLKFPKTYNPTANDGKKYPMLVFYHGLGEVDTITDNEYHLLNGASFFSQNVDNGTFDGYVLFMQSQGFFNGGHHQAIIDIINYMITNNKLDPFHIVLNGLSAGGEGVWSMTISNPTYVSAAIPMSWAQPNYSQSSTINKIRSIPIWLFQGGQDFNPPPSTAYQIQDSMRAAGGNFRLRVYPNQAHDTWNLGWAESDFWPFVNRAYSSNPWPLGGNPEFFPGETINVTLSLTPGFEEYEWRRNGVLIPGATSNLYTATQTGTYDARVRRNGIWSEWSRIPVVIKQKDFTTIPARIQAENFAASDGVQNEPTYDAGGGLNVGFIDLNDFMDYHIYVPATGTYPVGFRVATPNDTARFQLRLVNGGTLASVNVPNTGAYQSWQTVTTNVFLSTGYHTVRIFSTSPARWNINWFEFAQASGAVLPVNFVSIDVRKETAGAKLTWRVTDESGVARYVVEKSADGRNFNAIGSVNAAAVSQYTFTDAQVLAKNFYRVKSVDHNGAFKYSSVVSLTGNRSVVIFQAFPLPAKNQVTVQHSTARQGSLISIVTMDGKLVKSQLPNRNAQQTTIDLTAVATGTYLLRYDDGNGTVETLKLLKQ